MASGASPSSGTSAPSSSLLCCSGGERTLVGFVEPDDTQSERGPVPVLGLVRRSHPDIQESNGVALSEDHLLADASPVLRVDLCQRQQPELVRVTKRRNRQPVKRRTEQQEVLRPACASTASIGIEVVVVSKLFLSFGTAVSEQLLG
jgi:hypothetical protein